MLDDTRRHLHDGSVGDFVGLLKQMFLQPFGQPGSHFFGAQAGDLVENLTAGLKFSDIVQQSCGANVVHPLFVKSHAHGDRRRVHRHPVGMVVSILIIGDELLQDGQDPKIGAP